MSVELSSDLDAREVRKDPLHVRKAVTKALVDLNCLQLNCWSENSNLCSVDLTGIEYLNLSRMVKTITLNQKILRKCELQYPSGHFQTPMALLLIILILVRLVSFVLHLSFH